MNSTPLTQFLSNNQKEITTGVFLLIATIITGVFLLVSVAMNKETPAPAPTTNTYITINMAAPAPTAAVVAATPQQHAPRARKPHRKLGHKLVTKPLPQPSCPCADSTKKGTY